MKLVRSAAIAAAVLAASLAVAPHARAQQSARRVLTQADFDQWKSIQGEQLSDDGKWVVYSLVPQVGEGEVVVKRLPSGPEYRHSRGFIGRPETRAGAPSRSGYRAPAARITPDGRFVIFTIDPSRAEVEGARHAHRRPAEMPRASLGIMRTDNGTVTVIPGIRSFELPAASSRWVAYLAENGDSASRAARDSAAPAAAAAATPGGRARPVGDSAARRGPRVQYGAPLVLRDLATGAETRIDDVTGYSFTADGAWLGYTVASRRTETDGAYLRSLADGRTLPLLTGKGSYRQLAFDEDGAQIAFLSDREDQAAAHPRFHLYYATTAAPAARDLVGPAATGDDVIVSPGTRVQFAADGKTIIFGVAPPPLDSIPADSLADKAVFDLWHYADARLQPQQRVEAGRDRNRSFSAVYRLDRKAYQQLGDDSLDVRVGRTGQVALGGSSLRYAVEQMWGEGGTDIYVIDAAGKRRLVKEKAPSGAGRGGMGLSPDGRYLLYYGDDAHWYSYDVASGKTADLSATAPGVHFEQEDWDSPSLAAPWGVAGWTSGDRSVLLYDHFDLWDVDPAGRRPARVVTDSIGHREHISFRVVDTDTAEHSIDPAQPLLLSAMNEDTKSAGFWRDRLGVVAPPVKLVMMDRKLGRPVKAKNADVFLFTESTFRDFPDLWVSDGRFASATRVSDANPQQSAYRWGTSQLVSWRNDDGVMLQGILYKPDDFDPHKQYPMLVYYYERLSDNVHSYVPPAGRNVINPTVYVSNEYLVFEPDIVYTTGQPGPSALKSIVPGVQMLIDSGFVNPKAVGLQGQSWGGYQTAYVITQTNMFAAAMAGAPVADMFSAYGGIRWQSGLARSFQYEHTQSRIGGSIWEYPIRYLENSPLFFVDRVKTPLLIMSNDGDGSVPWYQGIELFVAMRRFGKEVYLIDYNGDEHNPTKRANQLDIAMRMHQFFDHHLKGAPAPSWMVHGIPFLQKGRDQLAESPAGTTPATKASEQGSGARQP